MDLGGSCFGLTTSIFTENGYYWVTIKQMYIKHVGVRNVTSSGHSIQKGHFNRLGEILFQMVGGGVNLVNCS